MRTLIAIGCLFTVFCAIASLSGCNKGFGKVIGPTVASIAVAECEALMHRNGRYDLLPLCKTTEGAISQLLEKLIGEAKAGQCK